ncbi:RNA 2',3'-cyclic phosphodiesterase, partial [bacterium]|nr:RNA 2',3'-cyclic phosphodiesterase [bacterium]
RPFSPHLTLGRVKSQKEKGGLTEALTNTEASHSGNMRVDKIAIIKSELKPQGSIYTSLEEISLKG